jgi:hypothetical protein
MLHAVGGAAHIGGFFVQRQRVFRRTEHHVAAHAGSQVQHHIDVCRADALGYFAIKVHVAARLAGLGVAHMAVDDCRTRLRRVDGGIGDLLGRTRHMRTAILRAAGPGHGTGNENLTVHRKRHRTLSQSAQTAQSNMAQSNMGPIEQMATMPDLSETVLRFTKAI